MPPALASTTLVAGPPPAENRVSVLLPLPLAGAYDYAVPDGLDLEPGSFVAVPLGQRSLIGVVWDGGGTGTVDAARLKSVLGRLDAPPMPASLRRFVDWVANYTLSPPGAVLRMAMSAPSALEPPPPVVVLTAGDASGLRMTPGRQRVLDQLQDGRAMMAGELASEAAVSPSILRAMIEAGALISHSLPEAPPRPDVWHHAAPDLSGIQATAASELEAAVIGGGFGVTLLSGVTGSGKTEVYFAAIAAALAAGKQALVLLPEIALSAQWLERFTERFGRPPSLWHSELPPTTRRSTWRRIARGEAGVVVGARSALFLPLDRLGVIVIDEEHDHSFKQTDGVIYQARDMAVVRARLAEAPIVLVSATPSLETVSNVESGRYRRLDLPSRHAGASMPTISVVDIRREPPPRGRWVTPPLVAAIAETLEAGEQAMLFLNRRGYAPLTLCRTCGHRLQCPNCSAWMVEHRLVRRLVCHHCGFSTKAPESCPSCSAVDAFVACGPGVERLAEEATALFPDARLAVMASDQLIGPSAAADLVARMEAREIDLLIGTQMVAKGHHFPHLTLVGVVDADLGLAGGDLRAGERTFQLLHQVAGRAGRAEHPGRVILQTADPEHPVIQALGRDDLAGFQAAEADERRRLGMPPFGRLAALIVSAADSDEADRVARALARSGPTGKGIMVLGPAPAPLALLRGRHRRRLLLKTARDIALQPILRHWLAQVKLTGSVRLQVDVDPYSFL